MKTALVGLICFFKIACYAAPRITGEVAISPTQTLKSEIELIDLTPGTSEHALAVSKGLSPEDLATYKSINYRVNLITNGAPEIIFSDKIFSTYAPTGGGPEFTLKDGWLSGNLCIILIEHSSSALPHLLQKQANGSWSVLDVKEVTFGEGTPCSIRKTAPQAIVQEETVNGVTSQIDRFLLSGTTLVPAP